MEVWELKLCFYPSAGGLKYIYIMNTSYVKRKKTLGSDSMNQCEVTLSVTSVSLRRFAY